MPWFGTAQCDFDGTIYGDNYLSLHAGDRVEIIPKAAWVYGTVREDPNNSTRRLFAMTAVN